MESFCKLLPKIELHAHLNGSLSDSTLEKLQALKNTHAEATTQNISDFKISHGHSRTLAECFALFGIAHQLTDTPSAVKLAMINTLEEFNKDGVIYLELRSTPRENKNMTKTKYIESMVDGVLESRHLTMKTCLLISIDRRNSAKQAEETVDIAITMNEKYPLIVVGLDLSGDPTVGKFSDFADILEKGRKAGLKVSVHAAEIKAEEESLEILSWRPDRLGHATCTNENNSGSEVLWKALLKSKIPIELCLTSNVKCGSVASYAAHHFVDLYKAGHPLSLNTDDKGVFSTSLSEEFFICANTFNLTDIELWNLVYKSIDFIFSNYETKEYLKNVLIGFKLEKLN